MLRSVGQSLIHPLRTPLAQAGRTIRGYSLAAARGDLLAGATVAVVALPQSMAYAIIAGVPPQYGIYTLVFQSLIGSLFSSHPLLALGPLNTQSLLVASIVTRLVDPANEALYLQFVLGLTLLKGVIQLVMALGQMATLVRFVSQSVIVGFTAGAAVLIATGQLPGFLGFSGARSADFWPGLVGTLQGLWANIDQANPWAVAIGVVSVVIVVVCRRISVFLPGPLLAVAGGALIVYFAGWGEGEMALLGEIPSGLPVPTVPALELAYLEPLLAGALALALLGLMEVHAIGRALSARTGHRTDPGQELFTQGFTNFTSSFLGCIPGSASFGRSALNQYAGARTGFAGIYNGLFALGIFLLAAPAARYIPMASIAAILLVIAVSLIDWNHIRKLVRANRADAVVFAGTFAATLVLPLAYAVFVGVFLNIALYLRRAANLHMAEMVRTSAGPFVERPITDRQGERKVMFLQIEGDLFFGLADQLHERLMTVAGAGPRVVILRLKRTHSIDATALGVLEEFVEHMQRRGGHVLLCGLRPELLANLENFGLVDRIGRENVFEAGYGVFTSAKRALHRAKMLVGSSIDLDQELGDDDETEGWAYEI